MQKREFQFFPSNIHVNLSIQNILLTQIIANIRNNNRLKIPYLHKLKLLYLKFHARVGFFTGYFLKNLLKQELHQETGGENIILTKGKQFRYIFFVKLFSIC